MRKQKILVAMSGGVDSSVAALLLKNGGHEVTGLTMCLGIDTEGPGGRKCCRPEDVEDARRVCAHIGIPHYVHDFSDELERYVIGNFIDQYTSGRTPNPCVRCNRFLKFGALLERAGALGFDAIATGHYARIIETETGHELHRGRDTVKDQSYFLYSIRRSSLERIVFPLGDLTKDEIRTIARSERLPVAEKIESQDICFVPAGGLGRFFKSRGIDMEKGDIIDLSGALLGTHEGIMLYTVGQRRGLGIGSGKPLYVTTIDADTNRIAVGGRHDLLARGLVAGEMNLLCDEIPSEAFIKIRYAGKEMPAKMDHRKSCLEAVFHEFQEAVTPGQAAVIYRGSRVLGGGIIDVVLR